MFIKNKLLLYLPDLYPEKTGGLEVYNYHLLKKLSSIPEIRERLIVLTDSKTFINGGDILPLKNRLFGIRRWGLGGLSTILYYLFSKKFNWREIKSIYIPYSENFGKAAWPFILLKKMFNVNYYTHIHSGDFRPWKDEKLQKLFFREASGVAGVSKPIMKVYKERSGVDVHYLPPIVPFVQSLKSKDDLKMELGFQNYDKIVLNVGSIKPLKAPKVLLSAFDSLEQEFIEEHKVGLLMAGDGILRKELEVQFSSNKNIKFLGLVPNQDVWKYYAIADVYVIPSWFEGTPISLLEAMSHSLCCIGSNVPGINTTIEQNKTGLLFEKDNDAELTILLKDVLTNFDSYKHLGVNAKCFYENKFSYDVHIKEFLSWLNE